MIAKYTFLTVFLMFSAYIINGQEVIENNGVIEEEVIDKTDRAIKAIKDLKDGVLVIRLKSYSNKIREYEKLIDKSKNDDKLLLRLNKQLKETINERDENNQMLVKSLKSLYKFSDYLLIYDYQSKLLKDVYAKGIFLNENLEEDASIGLEGRPFLMLRYGTAKSADSSGVDAMIVMDNESKDLTGPFPYYIRYRTISGVISSIFQGKSSSQKNYNRIIGKLNNNFYRFYEKVK